MLVWLTKPSLGETKAESQRYNRFSIFNYISTRRKKLDFTEFIPGSFSVPSFRLSSVDEPVYLLQLQSIPGSFSAPSFRLSSVDEPLYLLQLQFIPGSFSAPPPSVCPLTWIASYQLSWVRVQISIAEQSLLWILI